MRFPGVGLPGNSGSCGIDELDRPSLNGYVKQLEPLHAPAPYGLIRPQPVSEPIVTSPEHVQYSHSSDEYDER